MKSELDMKNIERLGMDVDMMYKLKVKRDFDREYTMKAYGYDTPEDYYWGNSSTRRLKNVNVPLFLLSAKNDPIADYKGIPYESHEMNENLIFMLTKKGGH